MTQPARSTVLASWLAAALAFTASPPLAAQEIPKLKPGLWEMTSSSSRSPGAKATSTLCLDASVQQEMLRISSGMMAGRCSKNEIRSSANQYIAEAECTLNGSTMRSKSVMTLKGDTSYHTEAQATFNPPLAGATQATSTVDGRYLGACKPGQRPGDLTANGKTINIRSVMAGKK